MRAEELEDLICLLSAMDRASLIAQFSSYRTNFPLDFTREFLETQSVDRLRHLLLAVCVTHKRAPITESPQAA